MAVNSAVKNRKELPISEKVKVLMYSKIHNTKSTAAHFGISLTTVKIIKQRGDELLELQEVNETKASSKRFRSYRFTNITAVNTRTWKWVQQTMKNGDRITNRLIKEKALSFAHESGILNFSASNGWFQSFRLRYGYVSPRSRSKSNAEANENKSDAVSLPKEQVNETKASSKRFRSYRFTNITAVNTRTWKWVQQTMKNGDRITNRLIKEKALSFAHESGILNFSASNGWFQSFRLRYGYVSPRSRSKSNAEANENKSDAVSLPKEQVNETKASSKRFRSYRFTNITAVNTRTWKWVQQTMKNGDRITNRLIKEKALSFAHESGILNFSASNGWFQSFRLRYGYVSPRSRSKSNAEANENKSDAVSLPKEQDVDSPLDEDNDFHTETEKTNSDIAQQVKDSEESIIDSMVNEKSMDFDNEKGFDSFNSEKRMKSKQEENDNHKTEMSSADKPEPIPCINEIEVLGSCDLEERMELNEEHKTERLSADKPEHIPCDKEKEVFGNCHAEERIKLSQDKTEMSSVVKPKPVLCLKQKNDNFWKRARTEEEIALFVPEKKIAPGQRKRNDCSIVKEVKKRQRKTLAQKALLESRHKAYLELFF